METHMIKQILFDLDNTIMDFNKAEYVVLKEVLDHYNIVFSESVFNQYKIINNRLWKELEHGVTTMEYVQNERFTVLFRQLDLLIDGEQANKLYH